ncbi:MAG: FAD-binding protein [Acidobacteriota bacterium]|nr:FAD-binding protein [Acidobacteriota bacterium]
MSKLNIACLLAPMVNTEASMDIVAGKVLSGPKKIMGKYGEIGLETAITYGEENPDQIHTDILSVGKAKEVATLQQGAIAMVQPKKHPGTLGVHALEVDDIDERDAFAVADLLTGMIKGLENQPDLIFTGRESWDYSHGVVGPAVAQKLGIPYYSGVNEVKLNDDFKSVTATFTQGNDKLVYNIALPAVFGTTDWLNGKDAARFTSLKGVMMAKKFKRTVVGAPCEGVDKTVINGIEEVKSERKNRKLEGDEGPALAKAAFDILVNQDKALVLGGSGGSGGDGGAGDVSWADASGLDFSGDVVLMADHDGLKVRMSTHQALSQARMVADAMGKNVTLLVMTSDAANLGAGCGAFGADRVVAVESTDLKHPNLENVSAHLVKLFAGGAPASFMTVADELGRDTAAYMASNFGGGLLQDVVSLSADGGSFNGKRIVSNARYITDESITDNGGCPVVSIRATAFDPVDAPREATYHKVASGTAELKASLQEVVAGQKTKGVPLPEASIVIAGGRGLKDAANFSHLDSLADLLGAAVGASRAVTDLEWVPNDKQIGQTGITVAPEVYIAVGISGAIQHLTGILGSKYIVAVNPDGDAPIHKHADLSIIDKWENVLPTLIDSVKAGS